MDPFAPTPEDRFSFGLWTVGNPGRDPFGAEVRPVQKPTHLVKKLAECGAWGVNLHDNDLVPFGSSAKERDRIVAEFKAALEDCGMVVPMATTNLFSLNDRHTRWTENSGKLMMSDSTADQNRSSRSERLLRMGQ
jgi:xylose isomerase